jgi:hypothetical protein
MPLPLILMLGFSTLWLVSSARAFPENAESGRETSWQYAVAVELSVELAQSALNPKRAHLP